MTKSTPVNNQQPNSDHSSHHHNLENSQTPGPNMGRSLGQILIIMVVLLVLVNIPFNSYNFGLAQLMPQSTSIVIQDGTLLKGSGPEVYVVDNYKLRPVSPEAFKTFFSRNRRINIVEDSMLAQFELGSTVYPMIQCRTQPEVYAVIDGYKRRVTEPPTIIAHSWDQIKFVTCSYLERLPDGPPIP